MDEYDTEIIKIAASNTFVNVRLTNYSCNNALTFTNEILDNLRNEASWWWCTGFLLKLSDTGLLVLLGYKTLNVQNTFQNLTMTYT